jgi:GNAT superfamily N-acetyltransferase
MVAWLYGCEVFHIARQPVPPHSKLLTVPTTDAELEPSLTFMFKELVFCLPILESTEVLPMCHTLIFTYPALCHDMQGNVITATKAAAAISFLIDDPAVHILLFGVDQPFRNGGIGTLLLLLAGKCCIDPLLNRIQRSMTLALDLEMNHRASKYLEHRGFGTCMERIPARPPSVRHLLAKAPSLQVHVVPVGDSEHWTFNCGINCCCCTFDH